MQFRDLLISSLGLVSSAFAETPQLPVAALAGRGADARCGPNYGNCNNGDCCSFAGISVLQRLT